MTLTGDWQMAPKERRVTPRDETHRWPLTPQIFHDEDEVDAADGPLPLLPLPRARYRHRPSVTR